MSFGMFCAIPLPRHIWDDSCANLVLPCFPLIGLLIGAIWRLAAELLVFSGVHAVLAGAVLSVTPFLLTGFLHLDGYMDTSDAVLSRRPLEEKLRILKDPHTGAFSVISLVVLVVLQFAAMYAIIDAGKNLAMLIIISVISRCCSSVSLLYLKAMPQSAYAALFKKNIRPSHKGFVIAVTALAAAAAFLSAGLNGLVVTACVVLGFTAAMAYAYREFRGVSGDVTGYSLVLGELCGLIALAVV
ncbi:MAG: adenosylcobinamide-GDP ribazoletransferase [Treponema sp.]|nr:adenosylcobinamide-GDP ribazoletransferase [Treponema sp.]